MFAAGREWVFNQALAGRARRAATDLARQLQSPESALFPLYFRALMPSADGSPEEGHFPLDGTAA